VNIYEQWISAKAAESAAVETRRTIEDELTAMLGLAPDAEGTTTANRDGYAIKATCRLSRKIDADLLQSLAADAGVTDHLGRLFRWKPELSMKEWKAAAPEITGPLSGAITTTAGRPSYVITKEETDNG
jgi:hypothetical protein